jgi:hypothetical protein
MVEAGSSTVSVTQLALEWRLTMQMNRGVLCGHANDMLDGWRCVGQKLDFR